MPNVFQFEHTVGDSEVDELGTVSCLTYLLWTRSAAMAHSAQHGWPQDRFAKIGATWVVRSHNIEYFKPATAGQRVIVTTWVSNFRKTRSLRKYKIVRPEDGEVLVRAETCWALIDLNTHVPKQIPADVVNAFAVVAESEEP